MGLIKVKLPHFFSDPEETKPCNVTVFVNHVPCLFCYSGSNAIFEVRGACQVAFLFYHVKTTCPLPFFEDLVISGTLLQDKCYEIIPTGASFVFKEIPQE